MATETDLPQVLLVEDDQAQARLVHEMLRRNATAVTLTIVRDGEEALAFLRRQGTYSGAPRPALVLLDLNMPRMDGFAVLADVKRDPLLKRIPIVVLTSSSEPVDIQRSYDLGANCYLVKPHNLLQFMTAIQLLTDFWFTVAMLPPTL
jgi:CheY-like chemotaxis protein